MSLFSDQLVAGLDEYELRWGLENVLRTRLHQGKQTTPEGPAGAALVWEFLAGHARHLFHNEIMSLRAAGHSWRQITEQLGRLEPGEEYESTVRVFNTVAGGGTDSWGNPQVHWRCPTCEGYVSDYGPEGESHPIDAEPGHKAGCQRLAVAVAAYEAERGEE